MSYSVAGHRRRSMRLQGYDYSQTGAYFVTLCTHNRECLFGEVVNGEMQLNEYGNAANDCWNEIPDHFPEAELGVFAVVPNHVHGIIVLCRHNSGPASWRPRRTGAVPLREVTLGHIVAYYKYRTAKSINRLRASPGKAVWQRNYYEHVIRNDSDLEQTTAYVASNALRWELDKENPHNVGARQPRPHGGE